VGVNELPFSGGGKKDNVSQNKRKDERSRVLIGSRKPVVRPDRVNEKPDRSRTRLTSVYPSRGGERGRTPRGSTHLSSSGGGGLGKVRASYRPKSLRENQEIALKKKSFYLISRDELGMQGEKRSECTIRRGFL